MLSIPILGLLLLSLVFFRVVFNRYGKGLNRVPGPFLASLTDLWRFFDVLGRRSELTHIDLHQKYGKVVRIGPRTLSISDSKAVQVIYGVNSGFVKSDFYTCQQTINNKGNRLLTLFTSTDEKFHSRLRRAVSNAYAMSTLVQFEPFVDSTTEVFLDQLERRFADRPGRDGICDFGSWLQYYAFDVIGELTYSKRLGFVDNGKDVEGIISNLEWLLNYASVVGQIPRLDSWILKNPLRLWLSRMGVWSSASPVAAFARQRIADRLEKGEKTSGSVDNSIQRRDFLSRFLEAHEKDPEFIPDDRVLALTVANMFAGSDTTAITLRAIFYYLMKNPWDLNRLRNELAHQYQSGNISTGTDLVRWNDVRELPFLTAVIQEALRCHPAVGITLERIVPSRGFEIDGHFISGGTIVGINPWVIHQDKSIFGEDANRWRPDRWIEASNSQRKIMDASIFSFGAGSRTCIGKNISLLEMYKLVPAVLRRFDIDFADTQKEWKLHNSWFIRQTDFYVRLKRRRAA